MDTMVAFTLSQKSKFNNKQKKTTTTTAKLENEDFADIKRDAQWRDYDNPFYFTDVLKTPTSISLSHLPPQSGGLCYFIKARISYLVVKKY